MDEKNEMQDLMDLLTEIDDEPDSGGSNIKEDAAVDEHERWRGRLFF